MANPWMMHFGKLLNSVLTLNVTTNADPHHPSPLTQQAHREDGHAGSIQGEPVTLEHDDSQPLLTEPHAADDVHHEDDDHDHDEDDWHHH